MEACEEATFAHDVHLDTTWAWEAAIIARKMRNHGLEVQIIERVLNVDVFSDHLRQRWETRLVKAEQLRDRASRSL